MMKSKFNRKRAKKRKQQSYINIRTLSYDNLISLIEQVRNIGKYTIALDSSDLTKQATENIIKQIFLGQGGNGFVLRYFDSEGVEDNEIAIKFFTNIGSYKTELNNNKIVNGVFNSLGIETHIIRYYENGEKIVKLFNKDFDLYYIEMEYIADDLEKVICEKAKDSPKLKQQYYSQIFERLTTDLTALHKENYIHRDLKPSNILIKGEYPILADFGLLAKHDSQEIKKGPKYWPTPEFVEPCDNNDQSIDKKTDIFQLGCIFYWITTQKYPVGFFDFKQELDNAEIGEKLTELITNMLMYNKESRKILEF